MALELSNLKPGDGATRPRKRVGRGAGSGTGKTCGKGENGQKARATIHPWFEGGQMPLQRRLPKRGFKNRFRKVFQIVNLRDLDRCEGVEEITPDILAEKGLIRNPYDLVKILGVGEVTGAVKVTAHAVSGSAKEKIEAAGGQVTLVKK